MTEDEYQKLLEKYGKEKTDDKILRLEANKNFKNYTDHYLTLNNWLRDDTSQPKVEDYYDEATGKIKQRAVV